MECRCTELETRCVELESVIGNKTSENEALEAKFKSLEAEKASIVEKLKALQEEIDNKRKVVDLTKETEEEGTVTQLMIENHVLQCEKRIAETEIQGLKQKLIDFTSKFEDNRTPSRETLSQRSDFVDGGKGDIDLGLNIGRRIGKRLQFEEDKSKKMAPSTPCVRSLSIGVIDICDSDDEKEEQPCVDRKSNGDAKDDDIENLNDCDDGEVVLSVLTRKRKRASKVVVSDSENEENDSDDDDVPICKLKRIRKMISGGLNSELSTLPGDDDDDISNVATPRRRLVSLRKLEGQKRMEKDSSKDNVNDESKDDSSSNSDSKDEFIVESSDESNYEDSSEDESEDSEDFGEIISQLNRSNRGKSSWEFEADMLAALGKDPELCMRAVCALYRRQTSDEQMSKETFVNNLRGFSKFDAKRGSDLAQFLTNGGFDLNKSVEDLKAYDPSGVEKCRTLAIRYSRQLFEIYKNKEDPHFLPG